MAKVLLVEDDNNLREIYEARLAAEGYDISSAQDGEEALVVAKQTKPDLVVSDVMMPKISGFEMLDILRNTPGLEHVKVIMLTALGQSEDRDRADSLGADKYLVKSQVTLEDIVKTAHELLGDDEAPVEAAPVAATAAATVAAVPESTPVAEPEAVAPAPAAATPVEPAEPVATPPSSNDATDDVLAQAAASLTTPSDDTPSATPAGPPVQPVEVAPLAVEPTPAEVTAPSEAATTELAGSAVQEQSALAEQINNFVQETPAAEPEAAPVAEAPNEAVAPSADSETAASTDDQLMAEAVTELTNNVEGTEAPSATTPPVETSDPAPEPAVLEPTQTTADAKQEAEKTTISISGKKTIQPLDSEPKPDINELLAREEATSGNPVTGAAVISGGEEGDDSPKQTEIDDTPAIVHQPGQSFSPQPQTDTAPTPPVSDEDVPSGGPAPAPSDKDGFDPNSVAL